MEEKNGFQQPEYEFPLAGIRSFFKNQSSLFPQTEKNILIKEYCFDQTESWFPLAEMENKFKNKLLLDEETASMEGISKKSKKMVANISNKDFKQGFL